MSGSGMSGRLRAVRWWFAPVLLGVIGLVGALAAVLPYYLGDDVTASYQPGQCTTEQNSRTGDVDTDCPDGTWTVDGTTHHGRLTWQGPSGTQVTRPDQPTTLQITGRAFGDRFFAEPPGAILDILAGLSLPLLAVGIGGIVVTWPRED